MAWAPQYASTAELRAYLRIPVADTADDTQIALAANAASRSVDHHCNRQFGQVTTADARVYTPRWDRRRASWVIDVDDISSTDDLSIMIDDDGDQTFDLEIDDYRLLPLNAAAVSHPWTQILVSSDSTNLPTAREGSVEVTAEWGWAAVPDSVKEATLLQGSRFFMRQQAPFGIAGSPDLGSELRLLQKVDVDVAVMLRGFVRQWGAA